MSTGRQRRHLLLAFSEGCRVWIVGLVVTNTWLFVGWMQDIHDANGSDLFLCSRQLAATAACATSLPWCLCRAAGRILVQLASLFSHWYCYSKRLKPKFSDDTLGWRCLTREQWTRRRLNPAPVVPLSYISWQQDAHHAVENPLFPTSRINKCFLWRHSLISTKSLLAW